MNWGMGRILKQISVFLFAYLIILVICFIVKLLYTKEDIFFTVNSWHFVFGDILFPYVTDMGDGLTAISLSLLLLFISYRIAFLMGTSYLITSLAAQVLKRIFHTPRPVLYFKDELRHIYFVKGVDVFSTNSFPSGHTVSAFSAALILAYITPKKWAGLAYLLIAIAIGYSRMYLSEHFFEDVVGGSALGVFITLIWVGWIDNKAFLNSPKWNKGLLKQRRTELADNQPQPFK